MNEGGKWKKITLINQSKFAIHRTAASGLGNGGHWGEDVLTAFQDAYLKTLCDYRAVGEYAYRKHCALKQRVPNFALRWSQGIRDQFPGDPWIHICNNWNAVYDFFLNGRNTVLLQIMFKVFNWGCVYFVWPLEYLIKKGRVPTKRKIVQ